MKSPYDDFIAEVEAYCEKDGRKPSTILKRAVSQSTLIDRLKAGGGTTLTTITRVRDYMAAHPPHQKDAS